MDSPVFSKKENLLDTEYSKIMSKKLGIEQHINNFGEEQVLEAIPDVVKVLDSFDPMEVRNSITINIGLRYAKTFGCTKIITGDGADELFAGYHMFYKHVGDKETLTEKLKKMWGIMAFSTSTLGENLGIDVRQPFLDPEVVKFAKTTDPDTMFKKNADKFGVNGFCAKHTKMTSLPKFDGETKIPSK